MDIGLRLFPNRPIPELVRAAAAGEEAGFSHCWVCDEGFIRDPYLVLAAIAGSTEHLRIGPGVTNLYSRHPAATAVALATLHDYSGGRAFLGLGAGGTLALDPMGIRRDRLITRFREAMPALRRLWSGETVTSQGETLDLRAARIDIPLPSTPIEIWLAARGPQMLGLAGEQADGVYINGVPKFLLPGLIAQIRGAAAPGRPPAKIAWAVQVAQDEETVERLKGFYAYMIVDSPPEVLERLQLTASEVEVLRTTLHRDGRAAAGGLLPDRVVAAVAVVGETAQCQAELRDLTARHAIDQVVIGNDPFTPEFAAVMGLVANLRRT